MSNSHRVNRRRRMLYIVVTCMASAFALCVVGILYIVGDDKPQGELLDAMSDSKYDETCFRLLLHANDVAEEKGAIAGLLVLDTADASNNCRATLHDRFNYCLFRAVLLHEHILSIEKADRNHVRFAIERDKLIDEARMITRIETGDVAVVHSKLLSILVKRVNESRSGREM